MPSRSHALAIDRSLAQPPPGHPGAGYAATVKLADSLVPAAQPPPGHPGAGYEFAIFSACFLATRLALLMGLGLVLHGREICDDLMHQNALVDDPWMILMGRAAGREIGSYAPFEGFVMGLLMVPLRHVLPDFYAWRVTMLAWEGLAGTAFVVLLNRTIAAPRLRLRLLLAFVLCPACWMASVVMPQDEVLIACFLALALALVALGRPWAALLVCGAGVVVAKIFLVLPLVALVLFLPAGNLLTRSLAGFGPVVATYAYLFFSAWWHGTEAPLVHFAPVPTFGVGLWTFLLTHMPISAASAQRVSSVLALLAAGWPLVLLARRPGRHEVAPPTLTLELARLVAVMYLWFFLVFYQVNPEYYELFLPTLLLLLWTWRQLALVTVALALPWLTNWIYGVSAVANLGTGDRTGKMFFVDLYHRWVPLSLDHSYALSFWSGIGLLTLLTAVGTIAFLRGQSDGAFLTAEDPGLRADDEGPSPSVAAIIEGHPGAPAYDPRV